MKLLEDNFNEAVDVVAKYNMAGVTRVSLALRDEELINEARAQAQRGNIRFESQAIAAYHLLLYSVKHDHAFVTRANQDVQAGECEVKVEQEGGARSLIFANALLKDRRAIVEERDGSLVLSAYI
jgi:hypothetical protein